VDRRNLRGKKKKRKGKAEVPYACWSLGEGPGQSGIFAIGNPVSSRSALSWWIRSVGVKIIRHNSRRHIWKNSDKSRGVMVGISPDLGV